MRVQYLFLTGIPGEVKSDLIATASLINMLAKENPKAVFGVQKYVPYPATELYEKSIECGLVAPQRLEDWIQYGWMNRELAYPWISPDNLRLIQMISFCSVFMFRENWLNTRSNAFSLLKKAYAPIARKRFQGMHYRFFPELKIARMLGYRGY